jgi:hypothetical protein
VTRTAVRRVEGATAASITTLRSGRFQTVGATASGQRADAIQYELGSGPCQDALLEDNLYRVNDLRTDQRWPEYGARVAEKVWSAALNARWGRVTWSRWPRRDPPHRSLTFLCVPQRKRSNPGGCARPHRSGVKRVSAGTLG